MEFDWDLANREHIARHGVHCEEAEQVVANNPIELGTVERDAESRTVMIGEAYSGRVLVVVITAREGRIRVVTAYPANRTQRAAYKRSKGAG